jgi:hypothetical protein
MLTARHPERAYGMDSNTAEFFGFDQCCFSAGVGKKALVTLEMMVMNLHILAS